LLCRMPTQKKSTDKTAVLQGTLDLLILRTLMPGPDHGQGIARVIKRQSDEVFLVDHGSLYLALQRLEEKGWVTGEWRASENNRRARFYSLTRAGRTQLARKTSQWHRIADAIARILGPQTEKA
jgi:PadR family transcriptional regulator PadR